MRPQRVLMAFVAAAGSLTAQYQWDFSQNPPVPDSTHWQQNGSGVTFGSPATFSAAGGGALIYKPAVSGSNPNDYDLDVYYQFTSGGGAYIQYVRASQDANMGDSGSNETCTGSFVSMEFDLPASGFNPNGTLTALNVYQCSSGVFTYLGAPTVSISSGMRIRAVVSGNILWIFINNQIVDSIGLLSTSQTGNPGIGGYNQPSGNGVTWARIGPHDAISPNPVNDQTIGVSALPNQISMQWAGAVDDQNGIGLWQYEIVRGDGNGNNAAFLGYTMEPEYSDDTAQPGVTYTYWIYSQDWHTNLSSATPFQATAPPAQAVDPRRIGVRPLGSYWGGANRSTSPAST